MPSFTSAPPMNFMAALKRKRSDTSTVITRPVHTIFPLANSKVSLLWTAEPSAADCFPDAAEVLVDVDEQAVDDHLLGGHRGPALQQSTTRRKLRVAQTTDRRGGGGAALPVQLDRLRAGAVSEVLRVPGIHLVEQLQAEIARSLPRRDGLDHGGDRLQHAGQVVGGLPHRPLLGLRHLLPVRVAELLQRGHRFPSLRLELLGERLTLCSHGSLLLPGSRFDHRLHLRQPFLEIAADHLVHVHDQVHGLRHEVVPAVQAPRHRGSLALGLEGELRGTGAGKGPHELELDPDQLARPALDDRRTALPYLMIAGPRVDRADPGRGALDGLLHRGIALRIGGPCFPLVEIVHLAEYHRRRGGHGGGPLNAKLGWPRGDDDHEHDNDHRECYQDLDDHGGSVSSRRSYTSWRNALTTDSRPGKPGIDSGSTEPEGRVVGCAQAGAGKAEGLG